jgi:uncharacterized membrane protein YfcA
VTTLLLFVAALVGGALNAVAGGGSFLTLPALLSAGVGPVSANATSTLAMWPGSLASALAYRREIVTARQWLVRLGIVSLIGGLLGGWLLIRTSDTRFLQLLPWLMLAAAIIFTIGGRLPARGRGGPEKAITRAPEHPRPSLWMLLFQFVVATYGGYFGGGMGIMMLASFSLVGMTEIHEMNGIKAVLAVFINGVALIEFIASGTIAWTAGIVMVAGGILGGYSGAFLARRVNPPVVRAFVIAVAWTMTAYFFLR